MRGCTLVRHQDLFARTLPGTGTGMAIRLAQDLGLHLSPDKWIRRGNSTDESCIFKEDEREGREAVWFGCLKADLSVLSLFVFV